MKIETKQKIKEVYAKYKTGVLVIGGMIIGSALVLLVSKPKPGEVHEFEVLPEWAKEWQSKCMHENLLCRNGLPVFATEDKKTIYSDAFTDDDVMNAMERNGYTIIERA